MELNEIFSLFYRCWVPYSDFNKNCHVQFRVFNIFTHSNKNQTQATREQYVIMCTYS